MKFQFVLVVLIKTLVARPSMYQTGLFQVLVLNVYTNNTRKKYMVST